MKRLWRAGAGRDKRPPGMATLRHPFARTYGLSLLLLALLLVACGTGNEVTIKTDGMRFVQPEVRIKAGQPAHLALFNVDGYAHAFDIDEFNLHIPLPASETLAFTFTPTAVGRYEFYCGVYGHREAGMLGTLIVEP